MSTVNKIAKNTSYLIVGRITTKIISFFILLYLARYLGPDDFGKYSFAFAFIYFFSFIPDLGVRNILIRDIAKEPKLAGKLIGNAIIVRLFLSVFAIILAFFIINLMGYPSYTRNILYVVSLGLLSIPFGAYSVIYEVNLKMKYPILFGVINRIFFLSVIFLSIKYNLSLIYFVFASIASDSLEIFLSVIFSRKLVKPEFNIDHILIKKIFHESLPVAVASVFIMIYFRIDVVMISLLKNDVDVGLYSAAYRLTDSIGVISVIIMTSAYPLMSKYFKDKPDLFYYTFSRSLRYLLATGVIIAIITTFLADKIILNFYGLEYYGSIIALQILIWAAALLLVNNLLNFTYIASGNQKLFSKLSALIAFINVGLNLLLIPSLSYIGAAVATVVSQAGIMVFGIYWISKNILPKTLYREISYIFIGAFPTILFLTLLKPYFNIFLLSIFSIVLFCGILLVTGWFDDKDKKLILKIFKKGNA